MRSSAVVAFGLLVLSGCAFQSGSKISEPPLGTFGDRSIIPLDGQQDVRGKLARVQEGMVIVQTRQGPVHLSTDGDTLVFSEGKVGSLSDLREGEPVRASVRNDGGKDVALWIETPRPKKVEPPADKGTAGGKEAAASKEAK